MSRLFFRFLFFILFVVTFGESFIIEKNGRFRLYAKNGLEFGGIWDGRKLLMDCQSNKISRFMFVGCSSFDECHSNSQECFFNPPTSCGHTYKTGGKCTDKKGGEKDCSAIGDIPLELPWEENQEGEFFGDLDTEDSLKPSVFLSGSARFVCQEEAGKNVSLDFFTFSGIGAEGKGHLRVPQVFIEITLKNGTEISGLATDQKPKTLELYTEDQISIQCRFNSHLFQHPNSSHKSLVQGILENGTVFEIGVENSTVSPVSSEWGLGYYIYKIPGFSVPKNLSAIKCTPTPSTSTTPTEVSVFQDILVREAPAAPIIIENSTVRFRLKETSELSCKFKGEPEPLVQWLRNDKILYDPGLGNRTDHFFEFILQLTPNVSGNEDGSSNYTCAVSNRFGTAKKHFIFESPASAPKEIQTNKAAKDTKQIEQAPKVITIKEASSSNVLVNIIFCAIILILVLVLFLLCRKYRKLRKEHEKETIDNVVLQPMLSSR